MSRAWTQDELAALHAIGDFEMLWQATVPLVKLQYGRMVRSGVVPGEDEWLQEMLLISGEAMRTWDSDKGAYSTYIVSCVRLGILNSLEKHHRCGITADHGVAVTVLGTGSKRPGLTPDDEADDDGTFEAVLAYGGAAVPGCRIPDEDVPEGMGDPLDEAVRLEVQTGLAVAIASLPVEEREALVATQTETQQAYAERTGTPLITVRRRIERARAKVSTFLGSAVY